MALHQCSICKQVGFWSEEWTSYGSFALEDIAPYLIARTCSTKCMDDLEAGIKSGKFETPHVINIGSYNPTVRGKPVGYEEQPDQATLLRIFNEQTLQKTRSEAWVMGGHSVMVMVEGVAGGVLIESVKPLCLFTRSWKRA